MYCTEKFVLQWKTMYCIHTAHLNFDQMHLKSTVLDNPGFTVLLVRTSMGARE